MPWEDKSSRGFTKYAQSPKRARPGRRMEDSTVDRSEGSASVKRSARSTKRTTRSRGRR